jgi:hypothetical protein
MALSMMWCRNQNPDRTIWRMFDWRSRICHDLDDWTNIPLPGIAWARADVVSCLSLCINSGKIVLVGQCCGPWEPAPIPVPWSSPFFHFRLDQSQRQEPCLYMETVVFIHIPRSPTEVPLSAARGNLRQTNLCVSTTVHYSPLNLRMG